MDFEDVVKKMLSDATAWYEEGKWQVLYGASIALALGFLACLAVIVGTAYVAGGVTGNSLAAMLGIGAVGVVLFLAFIIASELISLKIMQHALRFQGYKPIEISIDTLLRRIALGIVTFFQILLCWKEKKWLGFGIISAASIIVGALMIAGGQALFGGILLIIGLVAALPYFFGSVKHSIRLSQATWYFLRGSGILESLEKSWNATAGRGWLVFGALFVFILVVGVVQAIFNQVIQLIAYVPFVGWLVALVLALAIGPAWNFASIYGMAALYSLVDRKKLSCSG